MANKSAFEDISEPWNTLEDHGEPRLGYIFDPTDGHWIDDPKLVAERMKRRVRKRSPRVWPTVVNPRRCRRGHTLDAANLYIAPTTGKIQCRQCRTVLRRYNESLKTWGQGEFDPPIGLTILRD